jgi:crotonobetainyl-CoA:carnitine CoA-transferase CaiB-like acyl-CoA transferase
VTKPTTHRLPLEDVRIIAIEQFGAGPFGTSHLADLGADIIKIEDPRTNGDVGRYVPPFQDGEDSLFFETFNRNKRSLSLDITSAAGRRVFEDLVSHADAVISNLRGDVPAKLRIQYDHLKHINPKIVCVSLSGFGNVGPRVNEPGYDYILQGMCGWMSLTGEPDGPPTKSGLSLVDFSGGFVLTAATLAGIHAARRDGTGMDCDLSLYDTAMNLLSYPGTWALTEAHVIGRTTRSSHPSLVPFGNYPTADGWIVLTCAKEKFWERLCQAMGRPELAHDERFCTFDQRRLNKVACEAAIDDALRAHTTDDWLALLTAAGVPCGPIWSIDQAAADPHATARQVVAETEHPHFGSVRQFVSPVRVGTPRENHVRAPRRNEHAHEILEGLLGYDPATVADLSADGAFGVLP